MTDEQIAELCHEVNRVYCIMLGDNTQPTWADAPQWQKDSVMVNVAHLRMHPGTRAVDAHKLWLLEKEKAGWKYGPVLDTVKKETPYFVAFEDLPVEQQRKDALFAGVVRAMVL